MIAEKKQSESEDVLYASSRDVEKSNNTSTF